MSDLVRHRFTIPLDGRVVNLAGTDAEGSSAPMRITLTGTVSSTIDGSLIDVAGRDLGSSRYEDGPYVLFPAGSRVVESDAARHRYVVEVPRSSWMPIAFTVAPLAAARLVPLQEAKDSLSGAIDVAVIEPPAVIPLAAIPVPPPWKLLAGGAGVTLLLGAWILVRRRANRPEAVLARRAKELAIRIGREAAVLGIAFEALPESAMRMSIAAQTLRIEIDRNARAVRRLAFARNDAAESKRAGLRARQKSLLATLSGLVERLEATAAELIAHGGVGDAPPPVERMLEELDRDLGAAKRADLEVRAL